MPQHAALYIRFMEYEKDNQQTQSAANKRRRKNEMIGIFLEGRGPVGSNGNMPPLSQIRAENERCVTTDQNASTTITPVVGVSNIVGATVGRSYASPAAKKAKLDQMKNTPINNPQLGSFIKDFMNTINKQVGEFVNNHCEVKVTCTKDDIMKEYGSAKEGYDKAVADNNESDKDFYKISKDTLKKEMENFDS